MHSQDQISRIQRTTNTLYDLRDHTDVLFCKEIADFLIEKAGGAEGLRISTQEFMALVVSRFVTNQGLIKLMADKFGKDLQIIELGAGFTPHFLNLSTEIGKYIEIDFEMNSELKREVTGTFTEKTNIIFVAGDFLLEETWIEIGKHIDLSKPVLIFSEGVVAQYFNAEQKSMIAHLARQVLIAEGSCFVIDDTLRNHSELHSNPIILEGMNRIATQSGSAVYNKETSTFARELENWNKLFDNTIYTIDYILSKPDMDFALKAFKLIICANDPKRELEPLILEQSKQNTKDRIWK